MTAQGSAGPSFRSLSRGLLSAALAVALLAGGLASSPISAKPLCDPSTIKVFPVDRLEPGMRGTGYTVVKGRNPVAFDVRILGVLPDGIAPGVDFILVKTSGAVIKKTRGIAAGFSGSPVYIDGRLVGAISYGFFAADQRIGGVTPAADMVQILRYPRNTAAPRLARTVRLGAGLRQAAARAAGMSPSEFPGTAKQLLLPLAVTGMNDRALRVLRKVVKLEKLPFLPYRAGGSGTGSGRLVPKPLPPGSSFAAALSYGDLEFAGVGTTTARCGKLELAFGHPFFWEGDTRMGMNAAEVVTVVPDPSQIFGGFKLANVAGIRGTVDQDRLAGIRGIVGLRPPMVPVTSRISNPDLGRSRTGETDVVYQDWFYFLAAFHLLVNLDVTFDEIGEGSSRLAWTITGRGQDSGSFQLDRRNMYYSRYDVSFESIFELLLQLYVLDHNPFEEVRFTGVDARGSITERQLTATIVKVRSASSLQPKLKKRKVLEIRPGDTIRLRVRLALAGERGRYSVDLKLKAPRRLREGELRVRGGGRDGCFFCIFFGGEPGTKAKSLNDLIANLEGAERNFDLVAELRPEGGDEEEEGPDQGGAPPSVEVVDPQRDVVLGRKRIQVVVVRR